MPSMFVKKTDTVNVKVFVWENENGTVDANNDKAQIPKDKDITEVNFKFRRANYDDSLNIMGTASMREDQSVNLNLNKFQEKVLKTLLVDWDIKDDAGNAVPCNTKQINSLHPQLARSAVSGALDLIEL